MRHKKFSIGDLIIRPLNFIEKMHRWLHGYGWNSCALCIIDKVDLFEKGIRVMELLMAEDGHFRIWQYQYTHKDQDVLINHSSAYSTYQRKKLVQRLYELENIINISEIKLNILTKNALFNRIPASKVLMYAIAELFKEPIQNFYVITPLLDKDK